MKETQNERKKEEEIPSPLKTFPNSSIAFLGLFFMLCKFSEIAKICMKGVLPLAMSFFFVVIIIGTYTDITN